jgi:hypothetical protein
LFSALSYALPVPLQWASVFTISQTTTKGLIMKTYLETVRQRVALNDAEKYISYVKQDLKDGKTVSATIYTNAAIRKLQSVNI